jgi:hypothetical protein
VGEVPKCNICFEFFCNQTISYSFLYYLATYRWKALKKGYNFVFENMSIKIHMKKLQLHKGLNSFIPQGNLSHFFPRGHGCSQGNLKPFSLDDMVALWGNLEPFFFGRDEKFFKINMCIGEQGLKLPYEITMFSKKLRPKFLGEHML